MDYTFFVCNPSKDQNKLFLTFNTAFPTVKFTIASENDNFLRFLNGNLSPSEEQSQRENNNFVRVLEWGNISISPY